MDIFEWMQCVLYFTIKYLFICIPNLLLKILLWAQKFLGLLWRTFGMYYSSVLKENSPGISLEGMMLKLKLQYFGHLMQRVDSLEKTLMVGRIGGKRRRGRQRMRWLNGITDSMDVSLEWTPGVGDGQGGLVCCNSWGRKESDTTEQLIWSDLIWFFSLLFLWSSTYLEIYIEKYNKFQLTTETERRLHV